MEIVKDVMGGKAPITCSALSIRCVHLVRIRAIGKTQDHCFCTGKEAH
jgi:hypothetical protein